MRQCHDQNLRSTAARVGSCIIIAVALLACASDPELDSPPDAHAVIATVDGGTPIGECGDLAEGLGECTGGRGLQLCEGGVLVAYECPEGSVCGIDTTPTDITCFCNNRSDGICPDAACVDDPDCAPVATTPQFSATVDGQADSGWQLVRATFFTTGMEYPPTQTWVRGQRGSDRIDIYFGPGEPAPGLYTCAELIVPSPPPSMMMYSINDLAQFWSTNCDPSAQSNVCMISIDEASGATGRLRGSFSGTVGCEGDQHTIAGSFAVDLPFRE